MADEGIRPDAFVPLAPFSTLGVGGAARWFLRAEHLAAVRAAHAWSETHGVPLFVLGGGSNLVIADAGVEGLVLHISIRGLRFERAGGDTLVHAGAGEPWDDVVAAAVARGLAGIESLSGIPGSAGGTPIQNVGAYGQDVGDTIEHVTLFDRVTGAEDVLSRTACDFSYRSSRFKHRDAGRHVVCAVTLRLRAVEPVPTYPDVVAHLREAGLSRPSVQDVRAAVLAIRRRKGMVLDAADPDTRSVGSFFVNPVTTADEQERISAVAGAPAPGFPLAGGRVKIPAAWLIERAGFRRGERDGAAGISSKHTLAFVNRGGATARDVLRLAVRIKRRVVDTFGVSLQPEPVFVGLDGDPDAEYLGTVGRGQPSRVDAAD